MDTRISKKESNRRLLLLARFLDKLPPERFDFSKWVGDNWRGSQDLSCGTTGCALGWAATMPEFRTLGLRLVSVPSMAWSDHRDPGVINVESNKSFELLAQGELEDMSLLAGVLTFGLTEKQAFRIFTPSDHLLREATPKEVAACIRKFVKKRK